jgi:hypothetical protein
LSHSLGSWVYSTAVAASSDSNLRYKSMSVP